MQVESFILDQEDLEEPVYDTSKFLLAGENMDGADLRNVDPETQERLEALLEAAGKDNIMHNFIENLVYATWSYVYFAAVTLWVHPDSRVFLYTLDMMLLVSCMVTLCFALKWKWDRAFVKNQINLYSCLKLIIPDLITKQWLINNQTKTRIMQQCLVN